MFLNFERRQTSVYSADKTFAEQIYRGPRIDRWKYFLSSQKSFWSLTRWILFIPMTPRTLKSPIRNPRKPKWEINRSHQTPQTHTDRDSVTIMVNYLNRNSKEHYGTLLSHWYSLNSGLVGIHVQFCEPDYYENVLNVPQRYVMSFGSFFLESFAWNYYIQFV